MSADLKDLRIKLTPEAWAFVCARAKVKDCHPNEVVREIVEEWTDGQLHVVSLADDALRAEGYRGIMQGRTGRRRDDEGGAGQSGDTQRKRTGPQR